ncbi:MAG: hypothetical protein DMF53_29085 [Acidobacteria bacterium]|nr:MAG: hypothetical protein DMF53_29085 [Acidobacteriota bacterium]
MLGWLAGEESRFLEASFGSSPDSLGQSLAKILPDLGAVLTAPLVEALRAQECKRVCLIPCGNLSLLPLHAAPYGGGRCLLDEFDVSYAPSAQAFAGASLKRQEAESSAPSLVAIGDPDGTLPFAGPEAKVIGGLISPGRSRVLVGSDATRSAWLAALPGATHIHLACHGKFDPGEPLDASLMLARGERLTLRDLLDDPSLRSQRTRLAVLSACQTAITEFWNVPNEALGLPSGFLLAGIPGIVGSLWKVSDASTALLMVRLYEGLFQEGLAPQAALRQAQLWLRNATRDDLNSFCERYPGLAGLAGCWRVRELDEVPETERPNHAEDNLPFSLPYFWAGFVYTGC